MKKLKKTDWYIIIVLLAAALLAVILYSRDIYDRKTTKSDQPADHIDYTDYNGKTIGILIGTNMEEESFKRFPDSEYLYYDGYPDMNLALIHGKIDAYLGDEPALKKIHAEQPQIDYIRERLSNNQYSFAFRKNDPKEKKLCDQFNQFLKKIRSDGTYDEIDSTWFGTDESKKVVDMSDLTGKNGTIHVVTTSTDEPFSYIKDGKNVGFDIDVTVRFCREYGYALELAEVDFSARIPALASGKYEFTTTMNVTPEREESVLFSDPVSEGGIVVGVRSEDLAGQAQTRTLADYDGKTIGSATGTTYDQSIKANLPHAKISYYNSYGDMVAALEAGKIDGFCADDTVIRYMMINNDRISVLPETLEAYDFAFAFPKEKAGKDLLGQYNAFVKKMKEDGGLEALDEKWFGSDESVRKAPDLSKLSAKQGTLTMATETENPPFSFIVEGSPAGYEIDLAYLFCKEYGYGLKIYNCRFDAILPALEAGKADFGGSGMTITEERMQSVDFSDPHYTGGAMLAVRASDLSDSSADGSEKKTFTESIAESFEKTFIRENRWKMILEGIGVTCLITLSSAFFGIMLAFLICMFRRTDSVLAGKLCDLYVRILQGTPIVVLLMILNFIVFARSGLTGMAVAIVGFSLNFAAYASEIMQSGINSIDNGQREAALALGYSETRAFFRFIFPQARLHFLPIYRGEVVSLLKSTSVVGYIAVQDLTKVSDIIRNRTYDAFFPLIATAAIYFALSWIISCAVKYFTHLVDPKTRDHSKPDLSEISMAALDIAEKGGFDQ